MTVRARFTAAACCAAMAAAALLAMPGSALAESAAASLARIYAEDDFQTAMPQAAANAPTAPADVADSQPQDEPEPQNAPPPPASDRSDDSLGEPIRVAGIVMGILILLIVLYILVSAATGLRFRREHAAEPQAPSRRDAADAAQRPPGRLDDADALARQGRHAEAIHALLLTVIAALREGSGDAGTASTTAREIVRRAPLDGEPRGALAKLALTAELMHFGGRSATEERYRACLESARTVLAALPGRAA